MWKITLSCENFFGEIKSESCEIDSFHQVIKGKLPLKFTIQLIDRPNTKQHCEAIPTMPLPVLMLDQTSPPPPPEENNITFLRSTYVLRNYAKRIA